MSCSRNLSLSRGHGLFSCLSVLFGCTEIERPNTDEGEGSASTLTLQLSGTDDVAGRDDDFVILSRGLGARPSAALTISLQGARGSKEQISLTSVGGGAVSFDSNIVVIEAGKPWVVRVFGERVSSGVDDVAIVARRQSDGREVREDLTVIDGVSLVFSGHFQDRLPTNPDPRTEPRGVEGSTFALEGEADLDNIIRFSAPVDLRLLCSFDPVRVTGVRAQAPAGAEFVGGDRLIGEQVNLGPRSQFFDEDGDLDRERLEDLELHLASIHAIGESPWGGAVEFISSPLLDAVLADYRNRDLLLRAERVLLPDDHIEARRIDARLLRREQFQYDQWQLPFRRPFCGTARSGDAIDVRDSQLLTLLGNAESLDYRIDFFGFDADCLRGGVSGALRPSTPGASALCPSDAPLR